MRRLTIAPLPQWKNIFSPLARTVMKDDDLAVPWHRAGETAFWLSRSAWSLVVLARLRQQLEGRENITVWIPDYFCNATLAPLRNTGVRLVFYPVTLQLEPDWLRCDELAKEHRADLFILVHYFGRPTPAMSAVEFCNQHHAWLIEDAAHVLRPVDDVGEAGDFVLYSPHKHLPIPDGAVLVARQDGPTQIAQMGEVMNLLRSEVAAMGALPGYSLKPSLVWLLKRLAQMMGMRGRFQQNRFSDLATNAAAHLVHLRMSGLARRLIRPLLNQLDQIAVTRERNAATWSTLLGWLGEVVVPIPTESRHTPYMATFEFADNARADEIFDRLRRFGLPVTTWPDLPPEVLESQEQLSIPRALRLERFYLSVQKSLPERAMLKFGGHFLADATHLWQITEPSRQAWDRHWAQCVQVNILQAWEYGEAKAKAEGWQPKRFLISNADGTPVALAQLLTKTLPVIGGIARLNRGPLLISTGGELQDDETFIRLMALKTILREAQLRRWWLLRLAPELPDSPEAILGLVALTRKNRNVVPWGSGRINLLQDEQSLLMSLNGKWRNGMRKGKKLGVQVREQQTDSGGLELLLQHYTDLQNSREFSGLTESLIRALAAQNSPLWRFNLFAAYQGSAEEGEQLLGVLVSIRAGDTTIYLIGYANEAGRKSQASSVLLWHAILYAKQSGCAWFDIGGLNENTPEGIVKFKRGMNALPYRLVGEWR